ncbi:hypothetical protein [Salibacterium aidingense]|uniref:hypothetical protein n=1 Tax=Salibacterium aidingense TaxID=384933 RepID=UPI000403BA85|nr:hypothetical protein [Salibacterium aidingense]
MYYYNPYHSPYWGPRQQEGYICITEDQVEFEGGMEGTITTSEDEELSVVCFPIPLGPGQSVPPQGQEEEEDGGNGNGNGQDGMMPGFPFPGQGNGGGMPGFPGIGGGQGQSRTIGRRPYTRPSYYIYPGPRYW